MLSNVLLYFGLFLSESQANALLKNLYESDPLRCETIAKKLEKKHKTWATPVYFLLLTSQYKMNEERDSTRKVQHLSNSLKYAARFRKKPSSNPEQIATFTLLMESFRSEIPQWLKYLEINGLDTKYNLIARKASQFIYRNTYTTCLLEARPAGVTLHKPRSIPKANKIRLKKLYIDFSTRSKTSRNNLFKGLPTGQESIVSASREQALVVFKMVNQLRRTKGLPPVRWNENLERAANYHASDMIWDEYYEHESMDMGGKEHIQQGTFSDRIQRFYKHTTVGENIAYGYASGEAVFWAWYHSKGHYQNMIHPCFNQIAIGVARYEKSMFSPMWVMNLGAE